MSRSAATLRMCGPDTGTTASLELPGFNMPIAPSRLLLMRHAKSSWKDESLADHDRPLNKRGRKAARLMACFLQENHLVPSRLISSSATRALETAEPVREKFGISITVLPELYHASLETWASVISGFKRTGITLMIGHNPGLEELIGRIAGAPTRMPTGSIACLASHGDHSPFDIAALDLETVWRPREIPDV